MRDDITLLADVYRPDLDGRFPVLLQRTPYNKSSSPDFPPAFAFRAASHRFVVVVQDVRGRFRSAGEWYPFMHEALDGYDTVEWAAALPYSDGRVAMYGQSYVFATQMLAAEAAPPHLIAILPDITASDYHNNWVYQNGAFVQGFMELWASQLAQEWLNRRGSRTTPQQCVTHASYPCRSTHCSTSAFGTGQLFLRLARPSFL
jgi:putative CocE/NonD family hydrolase